jgi:tRNA G37 N-methylase TrmD
MQIITEDERQFIMGLLLKAFAEQPASREKIILILCKVEGVDKRLIVENLGR